MVKKAVDARERFEAAAMALFREHGYAGTTVPDIAEKAGLTERTFFRYFSDKPEVLFWRADELKTKIISAIEASAASASSLDVLLSAFQSIGRFYDSNRAEITVRHALVVAHAEFRARDMLKKQELADAIESAMQLRGCSEAEAQIAAANGMAIWRVALARWARDEEPAPFMQYIQDAFDQLRVFAGQR